MSANWGTTDVIPPLTIWQKNGCGGVLGVLQWRSRKTQCGRADAIMPCNVLLLGISNSISRVVRSTRRLSMATMRGTPNAILHFCVRKSGCERCPSHTLTPGVGDVVLLLWIQIFTVLPDTLLATLSDTYTSTEV